jgi:predicted DCC family thiol-disulfide oxidoreductase YuxK
MMMQLYQLFFTIFSLFSIVACFSFGDHKFTLKINNNTNLKMNNAILESKVILFDGVCNFCNTWVDFLLYMDKNKLFKFCALQSSLGKEILQLIGKENTDISSVVYIEKFGKSENKELYTNDDNNNNKIYFKSEAVLKVFAQLGLPANLISQFFLLIPSWFRDTIYDIVVLNRYNILGKRKECRCSDDSTRFL